MTTREQYQAIDGISRAAAEAVTQVAKAQSMLLGLPAVDGEMFAVADRSLADARHAASTVFYAMSVAYQACREADERRS